MKLKRWLCLVLSLCLLCSLLPTVALAAMTTSEAAIQFIKDNEGFSPTKHYDYQHYSIGYGSACGADEYPNGITEEEADALLRACLVNNERSVNSFLAGKGYEPTQSQYDTMVLLSYAFGDEWKQPGYDLPRLLVSNPSELELLNCMGDWVNAGGQTLEGLIYRRMRETYIFFHGEYNYSGNIAEDVPYACLRMNPNGGTVSFSRLYTFRGRPYSVYRALPVPTRTGYRFLGWFDSKGNQVTDATPAQSVLLSVTAKWEEDNTTPPVPIDPTTWLFTDVNSEHWFYSAVAAAVNRGLFEGYPDGSFLPNRELTRAMFVQVLYRVAGTPEVTGSNPFMDVMPGQWFRDAVQWAYQNEIVNGMDPAHFAPNKAITREQMATILYHFCDGALSGVQADLSAYTDAQTVSSYAQAPMAWAVGQGLINGVSNTTLAPKNLATRAQAATILMRLVSLMEQGIA